jgi:Xaa-Pro aminopeptidase
MLSIHACDGACKVPLGSVAEITLRKEKVMLDQPDYAGRIKKIQAAMIEAKIDLVILDFSANFTYLTGIQYPRPNPTGSAMPSDWLRAAILTQDRGPILVTGGETDEFAKPAASRPWIANVQGYDGVREPSETANALLSQFNRPARVAISASTWGLAAMAFQSALPNASFTLAEPLFWPLRTIKDEHEMSCLRQAAEMIDKVLGAALKMMKLGVTIQDIADEINAQMLRMGASGNSFPPGVIFNGPGFEGRGGPDKFVPLQPGCMVAFDIGLIYKGYCSDFGRSVIVGEPREEFLRHYQMLREGRQAAAARAKPGVPVCQVHEEIHRVFAGYGWEVEGRDLFGHNIGLDIHEPPYIAPWDSRPLLEGMVLTLEPRAYRNGIVGGRIEDMIWITADGAEPLTRFSLEPLIIA